MPRANQPNAMPNSTYYVLGGLAVGALLGYHFAPKLLTYQPYSWIHAKLAPSGTVAAAIISGAASSGQTAGSAIMAPVQQAVAAGKEIYSEVQDLFGDN